MTRPGRCGAAAPWIWSAVVALLICGPLLTRRGFALTHDMVFVPHEPFKAAWLGLDGSVPRAVPVDAVVSLLGVVVPGDVLQKVFLVGLLVLAGGGAATVVRDSGLAGKLAATSLYVWNPFVYERLAMGHWALLCGYAALPWVVLTALRIRERQPLGWPLLCIALSAAAFTSPSGGVLAGVACCCLLVGVCRAVTWRAVVLCVVVNLPWIVPAVLYRGGIPSDPIGVRAFAAQSDTPYGVGGSLLSLGGIWNSDVVPPGRDSWLLAGLVLSLSIFALVGLRWAGDVRADLPVRRLVLVGALGFALAVLPALPFGLTAMQWVDVHVPGGGLLRDSQKWVALLAVVEAVGIAALVTRLRHHWRAYGAQATWWLVAGSVLVPVAALPALAWGLDGRLEPVSYPRDWPAVADLLDRYTADGRRGDVAVLPWSIYRQYGWNADRPVLDPAPRFFPGDVVIADTLVVGGRAVGGEDRQAAAIGRLLARGGDVTDGLRRLGVGLVVVERGTPGVGRSVTVGGDLVYSGRWLELRVLAAPGPGPAGPGRPAQAAMLAGDALAGAVFLGSAGMAGWFLMRRARPKTR